MGYTPWCHRDTICLRPCTLFLHYIVLFIIRTAGLNDGPALLTSGGSMTTYCERISLLIMQLSMN